MKRWDQMPWSLFYECWVLIQFHSPLSLSSRGWEPKGHPLNLNSWSEYVSEREWHSVLLSRTWKNLPEEGNQGWKLNFRMGKGMGFQKWGTKWATTGNINYFREEHKFFSGLSTSAWFPLELGENIELVYKSSVVPEGPPVGWAEGRKRRRHVHQSRGLPQWPSF